MLLPKARLFLPHAGMSTLCQALAANEAIGSSLRHLDLSGNPGSLAVEDTTVSMGQRCRGGRCHQERGGTRGAAGVRGVGSVVLDEVLSPFSCRACRASWATAPRSRTSAWLPPTAPWTP